MGKSHGMRNQKGNLLNEIEGKSYWMKEQQGNFSNKRNDTFDEKKRYIGVRLQQGVPLLDRDWNELEDIRRYEEQMLRKWYIGNGTPDDGFKISACDSPENNFKIGKGRCLVDGFEVVNEPEEEDFIQYKEQLDFDNLTPLKNLTPPDRDDVRYDTVYLDVKIIEVRSPQNPEEEKDKEKFDPLLENSKDVKVETTIRHRPVWRVRVDEDSKGEYKKKYIPIKPGMNNKLVKLIYDSKIKHRLPSSSTLNLISGYFLKVTAFNVFLYPVTLELIKDNISIAKGIIELPNGTWTYTLPILGEENVPVFEVRVCEVSEAFQKKIVAIDSIWLVDYENAVKIEDIDESYYHHYYDLAKITREKYKTEIEDADIEDLREERGKDNKTIQSLAFKNDNVPLKEWPKLTCESSKELKIDGSIKVNGQVIQEGWINVKFNDQDKGWHNKEESLYNSVSYFRDTNGIVHLQGALTYNGSKIEKSIIFTLQEGYIPAKDELHIIALYTDTPSSPNNFGFAVCKISGNGEVVYLNGNYADIFSLDGITFRAK